MEQHRPELNRAKSRIRIDNMTPDEEKCQGVVTTVESKEEAEKLRLWQQGDEEMYTVQSVQARYENRFDPEVVSVQVELHPYLSSRPLCLRSLLAQLLHLPVALS